MPTKKHNNTSFEAYLASAGTQHENLHQLFVTTSRVSYFIVWVHVETAFSHTKNSGEVWKKCR